MSLLIVIAIVGPDVGIVPAVATPAAAMANPVTATAVAGSAMKSATRRRAVVRMMASPEL
nr:hypothetical protein GCM10017611_12180 [Rhodococcus wratislaviensis]